MSSAIAVSGPQFTADQLKLIKDTVAKGASNDELKLFLYRCQNMGLDPLKPGQIYFIKYGSAPGSIVVGIEGFRSKAVKTGKLSGIKRGVIRDDSGKCTGAWAEVYRSDWSHPAREEVSLAEYTTGKSTWQKMPETMIKKVAEAAALRMAFPDDLGGVYTKEEMDQAEPTHSMPLIYPDQPGPEDGNQNYANGARFTVGSFKGRAPESIDIDRLRKWIVTVEDRVRKTGQSLNEEWQRNIDMAAEHVASFENSPIEEEMTEDARP